MAQVPGATPQEDERAADHVVGATVTDSTELVDVIARRGLATLEELSQKVGGTR